MGLIAGGMDNGTVNIYNPNAIVQSYGQDNANDDALLSTIERTTGGAISALQFNPHPDSANLLATGSTNGEILISSLDNPDQPTVTIPSESNSNSAQPSSEITRMAWNTEVSHIIASASTSGSVTIWDLKQNKPWCELRASEGSQNAPISGLAWNPNNGMHLLTASADDRYPVLKMWDLRASMSMPLATMEGHTAGVLGLDWCPHDDALVLTVGKDNRTMLWDVHALKPIAELPNEDDVIVGSGSGSGADGNATNNDATTQELYGAGASSNELTSSQQKRYDVQWSPIRRGVASTCSFDRKVQAHSVLGAATKCGRPPKWMKPASGVSCGFGGSVTSFGIGLSLGLGVGISVKTNNKLVMVANHVEEPELKVAVQDFEAVTATGDYVGFAAAKAEEVANNGSGDIAEAQLWAFMQIIFDPNARPYLLQYLGFDSEEIAKKAQEFSQEESTGAVPPSPGRMAGATPPMSKEAEETVNQALLVGNFEAAVDCCIRSGNLADALVLSSCGGAELWAKTSAQYFASEIAKRPFLSVVSAVIHNKLGDFVTSSDPANWHETLAVICTYASEVEYQPLCEALGDHLDQSGDIVGSSLCYMCAMNLEKAAKYWLHQLADAGNSNMALHAFAVKVAIFKQASGNAQLSDNVADVLFRYAKVVADQGLFPSAAKYCQSNLQECKELQDRLYRSKDSGMCVQAFGKTPDFPYNYVNVGVAPVAVAATQHRTSTKPVANRASAAAVAGARAHGSSYKQNPVAASTTNGYSSNQGHMNGNVNQAYSNGNGNAAQQSYADQGYSNGGATQQPHGGQYSQQPDQYASQAQQPAQMPSQVSILILCQDIIE